METILGELRNERPPLTASQLRVVFTLLLDRVYNQKEAKTQEQVCDFFADELRTILSKESLTGDDVDMVCFIFTKNHSIFNFRVSSNGQQLAIRLAKKRYPGDEAVAREDAEFVNRQCEKNGVAQFSHYLAHLVLSMQIKGQESGGFKRLIEAAADLSVTATVQVLGLVTRLKDFIRTDSMIELSDRLREACLKVSLQEDGAEAKKLGKKDIIDFTDNLERVLMAAYNATKPAVVPPGPDVPNVDPTEEEKAE